VSWTASVMKLRVDSRPNKESLLGLIPSSFPVKTFLIDDGWQDVSKARGLTSFHEWGGMGASMCEVITSLKGKGVEEVGVWVTLQGYWRSIDPLSPLVKMFECRPYPTAKSGSGRGGVNVPLPAGEGEQWLPSPEKAEEFWLDWFGEMKSWGIGFVKGSRVSELHAALWLIL
jgi:hypothetical protein